MLANRDDKQDAMIRLPAAALMATEALRPGFAEVPVAPRAEEKLPLFWRVFGGTMLSIAALVCITVYQQLTNGINDLRKDVAGQHEARADLVKKEELTGRLTPMWATIKETQAAHAEITALKERCIMLQEQHKSGETERKQLSAEVQQLRDRLVRMEGRMDPRPSAKDSSD